MTSTPTPTPERKLWRAGWLSGRRCCKHNDAHTHTHTHLHASSGGRVGSWEEGAVNSVQGTKVIHVAHVQVHENSVVQTQAGSRQGADEGLQHNRNG